MILLFSARQTSSGTFRRRSPEHHSGKGSWKRCGMRVGAQYVFFNVLYIEVEEGWPSPMNGVSGAGLAAQRPNSPHTAT
jgi:hypothetical protein